MMLEDYVRGNEEYYTQLLYSVKDIDNEVFVVSKIRSGGTKKYIDDLEEAYSSRKFVSLDSIERFSEHKSQIKASSLVMVHQLHIVKVTPRMLIELKRDSGCNMVICVHDFCWFLKSVKNRSMALHSAYLNQREEDEDITELFTLAEMIIVPSQFVYDKYVSCFPNTCKFVVVPHIDEPISPCVLDVPIVDKEIRIGSMSALNEYKGKEILDYMAEHVHGSTYLDYKVSICVVGKDIPPYKESDFYDIIKEHNLHGLLLLNKWGETYCYLLSKCINSGLPVFYNNIGSFTERIPRDEDRFFVANNNETEYDSLYETIITKMEPMLEFIVKNSGVTMNKESITEQPKHPFYDTFLGKMRIDEWWVCNPGVRQN